MNQFRDNHTDRPYLPKPRLVVVSLDSVSFEHQMHFRFIAKGKKWYGWTHEQAEEEWAAAVRDPKVARITDEYGHLCLAKLATKCTSSGTSIGNKRSIGEGGSFNVGDDAAIQDATDSHTLSVRIVWLSVFNLNHFTQLSLLFLNQRSAELALGCGN